MTRLMNDFTNNEEFHKNTIQQLANKQIRKFGEGTYGLIYTTPQSDTLIKAIKFPKMPENELRQKLFINRVYFQKEQQIHEYVYKSNPAICCPIYKPIVFGPIMYLQMKMLTNYKTISDFRKTYDKIDNYEGKANNIVKLLNIRVKQLADLKIFHGDYKANNFMISNDFTDLKILDFGKSKTFEEVEKISQYSNGRFQRWIKQYDKPYQKILQSRKLKYIIICI